jgi:Sec-independent protein translocase protein TatA
MTSLPFDIVFKGVIIIALIVLLFDNGKLREQNERLGKDISGLSVALQTNTDTTRNALGQMKATTATIVLSQEQADKILKAEMKALKENFSVKINGLKSYTQLGSEYKIPVYVQGKDTIIYNNKETVYYTPQGTLYTKGDTLVGAMTIKDTVRIVVSKGKREQWWKLWQKRPLITNAFLAHPDGTITQMKSVLVE